MQNVLNVQINSPEKLVWEGEATSISSENSIGLFDILPFHANFITIIENKPIKVAASHGKTMEYIFPMSIIFSQNNNVRIYTNLSQNI